MNSKIFTCFFCVLLLIVGSVRAQTITLPYTTTTTPIWNQTTTTTTPMTYIKPYPNTDNIVFFVDSTDMVALTATKNLLRQFVSNFTNPERLGIIDDTNNAVNIKPCNRSMNNISEFTTKIDSLYQSQPLAPFSIESSLNTTNYYECASNSTTKLYILYFVTRNIPIGNQTNVKALSDNFNLNGMLTFVSMGYDQALLGNSTSTNNIIDWGNYATAGGYPVDWYNKFLHAVGGANGEKASFMIFVVLILCSLYKI